MKVNDLFDIPKNPRIKIDHYSWSLNSPYRVYEKEEFNRCCIEKIEELREKRPSPNDMAVTRAVGLALYLDPPD